MPSRNLTPYSRGRGQFGLDPLLDLHREMNRMFNDVFSGGALADVRGGGMNMPRLDVREKDGELCVMAELPGVDQRDLDIQLDKDVLTIRGERRNETQEDDANYYLMEHSYGRFERSVQLPFTPKPDEVKASFDKGVLTIRMPKTQDQGAHRIQLSADGNQQQPTARGTGAGRTGTASASPTGTTGGSERQ
jgi:HSP20 family protein